MNKAELIDSISEKANASKIDSEKFLNSFVESILENVKKGEKIAIPSLGSFELTERSARTGINPATGEKIQIAAKKAPKFSAAKAFKDFVA